MWRLSLLWMMAACAHAQVSVPKLWDEKALADWPTPIAALGVRPGHYSAAEYYAVPGDNHQTYPVYHPDREPAGYWQSLQSKKPQPLVDARRLRTKEAWIKAGEKAFRELDTFGFRTRDPKLIQAVRSRAGWQNVPLLGDGSYPYLRWVVTPEGVQLTSLECAGCHSRSTPGGTMLLGPSPGPKDPFAQTQAPGSEAVTGMGIVKLFRSANLQSGLWIGWTTPWDPDARVEKLRQASLEEAGGVLAATLPGTFPRADSSPWFSTKIPDIRVARYQRYIDATGTHRLRGPEDVARYGNVVNSVTPLIYGKHRLWPEGRQRLEGRYADEVLYAIGLYVFSLEPPRNPNPPDAGLVEAGRMVFRREGCIGCHAPPNYTTGRLTLAQGYRPPADHPNGADIVNVSVGTNAGLALKTRKGTGFYKIPSLRGVWDRPLLLHDGSLASLEEMFDAARLNAGYVPRGWRAPGTEKGAVAGHEFGLRLNATEKQALLAFLRTL